MASIVGNLRAHTFITKCCIHHLHQIIDLKLQVVKVFGGDSPQEEVFGDWSGLRWKGVATSQASHCWKMTGEDLVRSVVDGYNAWDPKMKRDEKSLEKGIVAKVPAKI